MHIQELAYKGLAYCQAGDFKAGIECLEAAHRLDDKNPGILYNLSLAYRGAGEEDRSFACLQKVIVLDPGDVHAHNMLGVAYHARQQWPEAEAHLRKALALNRDYYPASLNLANLLLQEDRPKEAREHYRQVIRLNPEITTPYINLADIVRKEGNLSEAESLLKKAIQLEPEFAHVHTILGRLLKEADRAEEAFESLRTALKLDEKEWEAWMCMGDLLKEHRQTMGALDCYKKAMRIDRPGANYLPYENMGTVLYDLGDFKNAAVCLRMAVEIAPSRINALYRLGEVLFKTGQYEESEDLMRRAFALDPRHSGVLHGLALLRFRRDELKEAETLCRQALEVGDNEFDVYNTLGNICLKRNEIPEGEEHYRQSIAMNPSYAPPYINLGVVCLNKYKNPEKAFSYFTQGAALERTGELCYKNLYEIPLSINPDQEKHFHRCIFLSFLHSNTEILIKALPYAFRSESDMLVRRIVSYLPGIEWGEYTSYGMQVQESLRKTRSFKWLIDGWRLGKASVRSALVAEALLCFWLGDPAASYRIFHQELSNPEETMSLFEHFYFCLSAMTILEEEDAVIREAVSAAERVLSGKGPISDEEKYYAGLLYDLGGEHEKAIGLLGELFPRFLPAGYKLAEIQGRLRDRARNTVGEEAERQRTIREIQLAESTRPLYAFGIEPIEPDHEPGEFLADILPLVHFMEVQEVVGEIFVKPMDIRAVFFNCIRLEEEDTQKESLSLRERSARAWQSVLEKELDPEELQDRFNGFSHFKQPAFRLGEFIQHGAKAELLDAREKHRHATTFPFALYLALNYRLYQSGHLTQGEAIRLSHYLYACMDALPALREGGTQHFLLDSVKDYFLEDNIPYIGFVQKLNKLITHIREDVKGKQSPILSFEEFEEIYEREG